MLLRCTMCCAYVFFQYLITGRLRESYYNLIRNLLKTVMSCNLQFSVLIEKHQSRKRCWINLPIASKLHFLEKKYSLGYTVWVRSLIRVTRGYGVSYFFFICRYQKYYTTICIRKIIWKVFMWMFYTIDAK